MRILKSRVWGLWGLQEFKRWGSVSEVQSVRSATWLCCFLTYIYIYVYYIPVISSFYFVCVCDKPFHRPIRHSRASMLMTTVWGQKCYVKEGLSLCDSAQHFLLVGKQRWVLIRAGPPSMHILWGIPKTGTQARKWENMTTWRSCSSK